MMAYEVHDVSYCQQPLIQHSIQGNFKENTQAPNYWLFVMGVHWWYSLFGSGNGLWSYLVDDNPIPESVINIINHT